MAASRHSIPPSPLISIPRRWLIGAGVLFIAPWLIAAGIYARNGDTAAVAAVAEPSSKPGSPGPWGRLTITPIVVSPPLEYISAEPPPSPGAAWRLPGTGPEEAASFLAWTGMPSADVGRLAKSAKPEPSTNGLALFPDAALIRSLAPDVRARVYLQLGKSDLNPAQAESFRFLGSTADDWFSGSTISPQTRALIEPLLYRDPPFLHFADIELARSEIHGPEEWRRLKKTLMRTSTLLVRLTVEAPSEVAALTNYWGVAGRRTDIRPLLESIATAAPDHSIDVIHLLPALARNLLYRYPKLTVADLDQPVLANCFWSALNFFADEPSDRFLDVGTALDTLRNDYYVIDSDFQLGDVVAFLDANGTLYHAAVYLADGLAFTKNGTSPMAPWTIMSIENIRAFYKVRSEDSRLIYHRRKDL